MITMQINCTEAEFKALDCLSIQVGDETTKYIKENTVRQMFQTFIRTLISTKRVSIIPGQEDYFKSVLDELTFDSDLDDGAGIPSVNQGELQSDGQVQQGDKGQGSGVSSSERCSSCNGECTACCEPNN